MSAATVPLEIVCPEWCSIAPEEHARELWNYAGNCLHLTSDVLVEDPTGHQAPLEEPRFEPPVRIVLYSHTRPDNTESASPTVHIGDDVYTVGQALALAEAIVALVERYRAAGGVA